MLTVDWAVDEKLLDAEVVPELDAELVPDDDAEVVPDSDWVEVCVDEGEVNSQLLNVPFT